MGRAIGLLLLLAGISLAAYALPTFEQNWPISSATPTFLPKSSTAAEDTSKTGEELRKPANTVAQHGIPSGTQVPSHVTGVAPMDKLRAATAIRQAPGATPENQGSLQPMSARGVTKLAIDVPRPVEVQVVRPALPMPSVIAAARVEAKQPSAPSSAVLTAGSKAAASTAVAGHSGSGSATGLRLNAPAETRTTTVLVPTTARAGAAAAKIPPTGSTVSSAGGRLAMTSAQILNDTATAERRAAEDTDENHDPQRVEKPVSKTERLAPKSSGEIRPDWRAQYAQRYGAPVYLGRPAYAPPPAFVPRSQSYAVAAASSRRFRTLDFWEVSRRNGM